MAYRLKASVRSAVTKPPASIMELLAAMAVKDFSGEQFANDMPTVVDLTVIAWLTKHNEIPVVVAVSTNA
ncbi:hypothetical protein ANCCEY_02414 [Ancylostoma ceylanicum]|uniref:Uncharacterized protein n=1 Tax=Ancylostoma ceylanicum TaxID=53326 RepID=A0A0D6M2W3_9BILA|nr:hypothetical protein ANCCEY_02414 [Ancylostoma ceylanicum]